MAIWLSKNYSLVAIKTPIEVIINPKRSQAVKVSPKKNQAIRAEVGGIKKKIETVLLAELCFIKNIKIVNAPNDTRNI